jgi:hypothetical protein
MNGAILHVLITLEPILTCSSEIDSCKARFCEQAERQLHNGGSVSSVSAPTTVLPASVVVQQEASNQSDPDPCSVAGTTYSHGQQVSSTFLSRKHGVTAS